MQMIHFFKDEQCIKNLVEIFNIFSFFSRLRPNLKKCEIAGIGVLKGVQMVICGMSCIDLFSEAIKILGTYFSYNSRVKKIMKLAQNRFQYETSVKTLAILKSHS